MSDQSKEPENKNPSETQDQRVTFVTNPLGIDLEEIAAIQRDELAELSEDLELEDPTEQLTSLAQAIQEVEAEEVKLAESMQPSQEEESGTIGQPTQEEIEQELTETLRLISSQKAEQEEQPGALPKPADLEETQSIVEALIFMSERPLSAEKIFEILNPQPEEEEAAAPVEASGESQTPAVEGEAPKKKKKKIEEPLVPFDWITQSIANLQSKYESFQHGFELVAVAHGYQFRTKPSRAVYMRRLAKVQTQRLSSGALETLCIVAYRQPVLKEDIDKIRGVDSSYFIRSLMDRKLIQIDGRSDLPGRPILYSTTEEFLKLFGVKDLQSLPPLAELENMVPASEANKDEDPRVLKLRSMVQEMAGDKTRIFYDPKEDEQILKDIREKVTSIPVSTPYLEEQKRLEQEGAEAARMAAETKKAPQGELGLNS